MKKFASSEVASLPQPTYSYLNYLNCVSFRPGFNNFFINASFKALMSVSIKRVQAQRKVLVIEVKKKVRQHRITTLYFLNLVPVRNLENHLHD
jgi:hypothetical protein